jgi:hypothetical protein
MRCEAQPGRAWLGEARLGKAGATAMSGPRNSSPQPNKSAGRVQLATATSLLVASKDADDEMRRLRRKLIPVNYYRLFIEPQLKKRTH